MQKKGLRTTFLKLLALSMIMVMIITIVPMTTRSESLTEYTVIVLTESKTYSAGDIATIEVHFFLYDEHVDADTINLSTGFPPFTGRYIEVGENTTKLDTGIYRITFQLTDDDFLMGGKVPGNLACFKDEGRAVKGDVAMFQLFSTNSNFHTKLTVDKPIFEPGDNVIFTANCTNFGISVDADYLQAVLMENGIEKYAYLSRVNTGNYTYTYHAPDDNESKDIKLIVRAAIGGAFYTEYFASARYDIFQFWLIPGTMSETDFVGELGVFNLDGSPVIADIDLTYSYLNFTNFPMEKTILGKTNASGLLPVHLVYPDIKDVKGEGFTIDITAHQNDSRVPPYLAGRVNRAIRFAEDNGDSRENWGYGADAVPRFDQCGPRRSNTDLDYSIYRNGQRQWTGEVVTFAYDPNTIGIPGVPSDGQLGSIHSISRAPIASDGTTSATIPPMTLSANMAIDFKFKIILSQYNMDMYEDYVIFSDSFEPNPGLGLTIDDFGFGQNIALTSQFPDSSGDEVLVDVFPLEPRISVEYDIFSDVKNRDNRLPFGSPLNLNGFNHPQTGTQSDVDIGIPDFMNRYDTFAIFVGSVDRDSPLGFENPFGGTVAWNYLVIDGDGNPVDDPFKNDPPVIQHIPITVAQKESTITITATVTDDHEVKEVKLFYVVEEDGKVVVKEKVMSKSGDIYSVDIAAVDSVEGAIEYWIEASDGALITEHDDEGQYGHMIELVDVTHGDPDPTDDSPPVISHTPVTTTIMNESIVIMATITDDNAVLSARLGYFRTGFTNGTKTLEMAKNGDTFTATIPASDVNFGSDTRTEINEIDYFISATDGIHYDFDPEEVFTYHTITIIDRDDPPVIQHSHSDLFTLILDENDVTISAVITDDIGVTEAHCYYGYTTNNSENTYLSVSMTLTGEDTYTATLPIENITPGDLYYYFTASDGTHTVQAPENPEQPFKFSLSAPLPPDPDPGFIPSFEAFTLFGAIVIGFIIKRRNTR